MDFGFFIQSATICILIAAFSIEKDLEFLLCVLFFSGLDLAIFPPSIVGF